MPLLPTAKDRDMISILHLCIRWQEGMDVESWEVWGKPKTRICWKAEGIFNPVKKKKKTRNKQPKRTIICDVINRSAPAFQSRLLGRDEENPSGIQGANSRNEGLSPFGNGQCLIKMHGPLFKNLFAVAQRQTHYWRLAFNVKHRMKSFPRGLSVDI